MNKIWLITRRELFTRIRKRSFIIMTFLGPLLFAGYFALSVFFATHQETDQKKIAVFDSTGLFSNKIANTQNLEFEFLPVNHFEKIKAILPQTGYYGVLYITPPILLGSSKGAVFYSYLQPGVGLTQHINNALGKEVGNLKLQALQVEKLNEILAAIHTSINIETVRMSDKGEKKQGETGIYMAIAYISSFLIYLFIMMYGVQVMRGVIEEKTNRIVEVIISSVKPIQLMMGKVFGIALAALLQFGIWVLLSVLFIQGVKIFASAGQGAFQGASALASSPELVKTMLSLNSINFFKIIGLFIFYFVSGYLLYGSLFAAVGAAVDNDADTQQFVLPITLPLILGMMVMINVFQNPDSSLAFWFSLVPFTSPIVMMARIPYGVPVWQISLSMALLVITFISAMWVAAKIYRTGILMYGKKASYKEMIKWLRY
jgi:ABC-2 type transport system permease protein